LQVYKKGENSAQSIEFSPLKIITGN